MYTCNLCTSEPFRVPADEIGVELMWAHLETEHDVVRTTFASTGR